MTTNENISKNDVLYLNRIHPGCDFTLFSKFTFTTLKRDCKYYSFPYEDLSRSNKGNFLFNKDFFKKEDLNHKNFWIVVPEEKFGLVLVLISDNPLTVIENYRSISNKFKDHCIHIVVPGIINAESLEAVKKIYPYERHMTLFSETKFKDFYKILSSSIFSNNKVTIEKIDKGYKICNSKNSVETENIDWYKLQRKFRLYGTIKHIKPKKPKKNIL